MNLERDQIHAWVDGRLGEAERERVERLLDAEPAAREEADAFRRQAEALRSLGSEVLGEPVPARLLAAASLVARGGARGSGRARQWAAAAMLALVAWSLGWLSHGLVNPGGDARRFARSAPPRFVQDAVAAHAVYTPEVRHPVEVAAAQQEHLVQWLSKRLGAPLGVPSLDALGWALVGGRLLPGVDGARAQFMYQDGSGARLTLYVADAGVDSHDTAFRFDQEGPVAAFYWIDGPFGYALSAETNRERLLALAEEVYRQLQKGNAGRGSAR